MRKVICIFALACASSAAQVILPTLPCGQATTLYSLNANTPTTVEFVNTTAQTVLVYWLDYVGVRELYHTLAPGTSFVQATFYTHPWMITDVNNNCIAAYQPAVSAGIARISVSGIVLSQTGFTFQAVQGGPTPPASTFKVLDGSAGSLDLSLSASAVSGGNWLSVSPTAGTVFSVNPPPIFAVTINPTGLIPGDYYGQIQIDSQAASNAPQFLSVVLNISGSGAAVAPSVQPSGLTFVAPAPRANPNTQVVHMAALANRPSPFSVSVTTTSGGPWLSVNPSAGVLSPGQPLDLQISATTNQLPGTGSDQGVIAIAFPQDNVVDSVNVVFIAPAASSSSSATSASVRRAAAAAACTPSKLLPTFTLLGSNFVAPAAWPAPVEVSVTDDCGSPMLSGSVGVAFSNGDPPLALLSQLNGSWSGTWAPNNARTGASVTATASQPATSLTATVTLDGNIANNAGVPQLSPGGVVSAASFSASAAPSPGELVSIFGQNMANGTETSMTLPLGTQLSGASLLIAGRLLPLVFTSTGQINAVMPFEVPAGAIYQMVLQRGTKLSVPQTVTVTPAEPGVFTTNGTGQGQGHIYKFPTPTQQILADASNPATAGDVIVIYCSGLGSVSPAVADGAATPFDTLRQTVKPVTLTIGGVAANVGFAGLTPGFTGLYQVNAVVPAGIQPGLQTPVILTTSSLSSAPVAMAIQ
jgi:uncharacterized protein (TIGR03437 family)